MADGDPTGADLCSGTTDGSTLAEAPNYTEREIDFGAGVALTSGTQYAICIRQSEAASADAFAVESEIFPDADYAGGYFADSDDSGSTWSQDDWIDLWFKTKAAAVEKDTYTDDGYDLINGYGTKWYSQIFTAGSDYTITSIILRLGQYGGGTPGTITVSIKAVEGAPSKAITPAPTDTATDVTLDQDTITWEDGGGATSYDVYYGNNTDVVAAVDNTDTTGIYRGNQAGTSFTVAGVILGSPYEYVINRYWRIDSVNDAGTTKGDVWSFTTIKFNLIQISYALIDGGSGSGPYGTSPDFDDPPGVEGTDWRFTGENNLATIRRLVAAANNKIWYEDN